MRIAVKYCGNCNPEIDAPRIIGGWLENRGDEDITYQPEGRLWADLLIIICGCRKACVDQPGIRAMAKEIILIKGRWINGHPSGEHEIVRRLMQSVESIKGPQMGEE